MTADAFAQASRCYAQGNVSLAEEFCWSVLSEVPNHAEALQLLGLIASKNGELDQAIDYLNRSLICDGTNADTWQHLREAHNNLGVSLKAKGRLAGAVEPFQNAVRLEPNNPEYAYNLAVTLHQLGEFDRAEACYRQVIRLKPDHADASNNLGTLLKELGLLSEAAAQFQETLKIRPDHAMAYYNLSELAIEGKSRLTPQDRERIKAMVDSERCTATDRTLCSFALAALLDQEGSYDEAFAYYQKANDLRKRVDQERNRTFDARRHEAFIGRIIRTHNPKYFQRVQGWGIESDLPVFIVGMPRSGSTLVEQILASHPQVHGAGELGEIPWLIGNVAAEGDENAEFYSSPLLPTPSAAKEAAATFLNRIAKMGNGAARVTIKTLDNYLHLGVIATLFPGARIIHCRRDPLDVCLSCYFQNFFDLVFAWSLEDIGVCYRSYETLMDHWAGVLPLEIHEVCYEELVHDQETVTRKLLACCGLDWDKRCLTYYNTRRAVRTASGVQVRRSLAARTIGRWKHYHSHLGPLFRALGQPFRNDTVGLTPGTRGLRSSSANSATLAGS